MTSEIVDGDPASLLADAPRRLAHLGFLLENALSERIGATHLLVALRAHPTFAHFDPELVRYWRTGEDRRGHPAELTRETPTPLHGPFSWGKVEVIDRLGIENTFATLGGELTFAAADPGLAVALFTSPGPILRLGGHSQDVDRVALELGAFFARMMVPIDFQAGMEAAVSAASPLERYAAFVAFEQARYAAHAALREENPGTAAILGDETERLSHQQPEAWAAGRSLLERMGLDGRPAA